ncbi:MAG TPA: transposase [Dictyobacter sp.]|jgi:predicted RNA-binding Zn-ribbon protein involved in translation (DUF1610 family)|nr:transposase [Dictyobacter sp.]
MHGITMVAVPPKYTSQDCSGCDKRVWKTLSVRTHSCPHCGLLLDRDQNAALNILKQVTCTVWEQAIHRDRKTLLDIGPLRIGARPVGTSDGRRKNPPGFIPDIYTQKKTCEREVQERAKEKR